MPRELLTADLTLYVRSDGNDLNNGRADTPEGAVKTFQKAVALAALLDFGNRIVTIQHGSEPGPVVFHESVAIPRLTGALQIRGQDTPGNTVIRAVGDEAISANNTLDLVHLWNLTLEGGANCLKIAWNSTVAVREGVVFGPASFAHVLVHDQQAMYLNVTGSVRITGSAPYHLLLNGGAAFIESGTIALENTPQFTAFIAPRKGAQAQIVRMTFTGAAKGMRYWLSLNSILDTFNAGPLYLPGDAPGISDASSVYA